MYAMIAGNTGNIMSNVPAFQRCANCDQVITRKPVFMAQRGWFCRHCAKAIGAA